MSNRYPADIRRLNDLLRSDLGSNPRYAWRWSTDLVHVMSVVDQDGNPQYVESKTPGGLTVMVKKTMTRLLLPEHEDCFVLCALVEVDSRDGSITGTGNHAWIPVSGPAGPVALDPFEHPKLDTTQYVIGVIRADRDKTIIEKGSEWDASMAKREKDKWNRAYDEIRDAATAYYSVPGSKSHVSFPTIH